MSVKISARTQDHAVIKTHHAYLQLELFLPKITKTRQSKLKSSFPSHTKLIFARLNERFYEQVLKVSLLWSSNQVMHQYFNSCMVWSWNNPQLYLILTSMLILMEFLRKKLINYSFFFPSYLLRYLKATRLKILFVNHIRFLYKSWLYVQHFSKNYCLHLYKKKTKKRNIAFRSHNTKNGTSNSIKST